MSMLSGTLKNLGALLTSNAVSILTELVLPVIFIHRYGNELYAAWIALSAAVAYLGNLNFGVQTFVNQDLAVRYQRGERDTFHVQQSTALRILASIAGVAGLISCVVFVLPVERWLRLPLSHAATSWSLFFFAMQVILAEVLFGFFTGSFMIVGLAHRGTHWSNFQRFGSAILLVTLALLRLPLPVLAGAQTIWFLFCMAGVLIDLRKTAADIFPTLRYWDRASVRPILSKSGYFGMIVWSTFFCYQLPVILLQRISGPVVVVTFQLMRKIFGLGRQVLNGLTQSMGPEITGAFGRGEWDALAKLYTVSERIIFLLISLVNLPLLYLSPLLLLLWVHRPGYFELLPYVLLCAVNTMLCVKEHKCQFQYSTNTHEKLARIMFLSYLFMALISYFAIHRYGLTGFLTTWLLIELLQTWLIVGLNQQLFARIESLSHTLVQRLLWLASGGIFAGYLLLRLSTAWTIPVQIASDLLLIGIVGLLAYRAFDVQQIQGMLRSRLGGRFRTP